MKKSIICLVCAFVFAFLVFTPNMSTGFAKSSDVAMPEISAKSGLLIDYNTGSVIFEKNANERLPIASMTKLATLAIVFDFIDKGIVKENDLVNVSETAAAVGGSSAFLDAGSSYKVTDLIKSVIVASANDSSVALAEYVAGSEDVFVSKMNKMAKEQNLQNTNFENCTGLPSAGHYSSANDIANIYKTMCNHRLYKKYSKIWIDDFMHPSGRKTGLVNTNRLVKTYDGIEGGKTGYTDAAKFCLAASAKRENMRLVGVVIGVSDSKTRFAEMTKLLNFGFANYQNKMIVNNEVPVTIHKFKNAKTPIEVFAERDSVKFLSKTEEQSFTTDFQINEVKCPLKAGDVVGKLFVFDKNNMVVDELSLVVKNDVDTIGFKESLKKLTQAW